MNDQPTQDIIQLRLKYAGRIQPGNTGAAYGQHVREMEALLQEWGPVGGSAQDVIFLLGAPTERTDKKIVYLFEDGFGGVYWVFRLSEGHVVKVERGSAN